MAELKNNAQNDDEAGNFELAKTKREAANELELYHQNGSENLNKLKQTSPTEQAAQAYPLINDVNAQTYQGYTIIKKANEFSNDDLIMTNHFLYDLSNTGLLLLKKESPDIIKFTSTYIKLENFMFTAKRSIHTFGVTMG
ncbi:MAG: hypothetical protein K2X39_06890, partial [Silvanigrellaceae bacterium]|nr:hypothetical protein [Silvanigrellaceae bacterium]